MRIFADIQGLFACVSVCFATLVKCVNDTTVLGREGHAIGTVWSWGQPSAARRVAGASALDSR
jgi:hypothetical protein